MAKIGIVTVLYNSAPVLKDFFFSLEKQTYNNFILYVIDNASKDNSLEEATKLSKEVSFKCVILSQSENYGVAKGNNIGIQAALKDSCDYVLLSNNDVVLEKDSIDLLFKGVQQNHATMVVPKIYYWQTDKILWAAGGYFNLMDCSSRHFGARMKDSIEYNMVKKIDYAPTCFMLIRSDVFERVGLMDETFFVYYDDSDFVWRAVIKGQEKLYYIPNSVIWHKESFSTGGDRSDFSIRFLARNRILFAKKHLSRLQQLRVYAFLFVHYVVRDLFILSSSQRRTLKAGIREGYLLASSQGY